MPTIQANPLGSPADRDHHRAHARRRGRWQLWRSPDDQPRWARPALLGIALLASFLYAWNITRAGYAPFYSVAVKSMSESWKALFYGAFDPKATITIDKLAGSFVPQALSARIFGFSAWSLALPQVIEGVVSVLVMYRVVRRWTGAPAGLLAAGIFALTPIAASMFGHSMEDGALTMCLVLASDAYQRAVMEARLRSLLMAGVWVGLGFQAKMLQAWMVLPALAIAYLVAAPTGLRRRLWQLAVAGVVTLAVSLSWIALYTFTPASDRPFIDGSTNNSAIAMVFGYNGLERFGVSVNGAVTSGPGVTSSGSGTARSGAAAFADQAGAGPSGAAAGPSGTGSASGNLATGGTRGTGAPAGVGGASGGSSFGSGWTKLLGSDYGPEIGWLYPLAVLALIFGLAWAGRARRDDQVRAGFVMWGSWLLTYGLIFSTMSSIPHTAYLASLAPPLAALPAAGIVMFWRAFRAGGWRAWTLPAAVAAELAWALFLWHYYPGFLPWARDAAVIAGAVAALVMIAARLSRRSLGRPVTVGLAVGAAAMIAAPAAWAASVLDTAYGGSSFNASAGPVGSGAQSGTPGAASGRSATGALAGAYAGHGFPEAGGDQARTGLPASAGGAGGGGAIGASATTTLTSAEQRLYEYLSAHRDGAGYLMAVSSWEEAGEYILATGQEVLNMGGFSGTVPEPTLAQVKELVRTGQLRYFLVSGGTGGLTGGSGTAVTTAIDSWVASACTQVPAKDYSAGTSTMTTSAGTLYVCTTPATTARSRRLGRAVAPGMPQAPLNVR